MKRDSNMKRVIILLLCYLFSCFFALSAKDEMKKIEPFPFQERYILAVTPFEDKTKNHEFRALAEGIPDQIIGALFPYNRFRIIEREKIKAIILELNFQQTDLFKKDVLNQMGRQLGAEVMLIGSIVDVSESTETKSLGILKKEEKTVKISLEARLILISTGEIMAISKWNGEEKSAVKKAFGASKNDSRNINQLISEAVRKAVKQFAYEIARDSPKKK